MSVGQGRGRKKKECVFVDVSKPVSSCLWHEDGGKNSLAPLPSSDRKTAAGREEGREGKMEREGEGEGLVWSTLKVFPQHAHSHRCTDWAPSEDCGKNVDKHTHTHTVLPHLQINSSFHYDLLNWTEDNIWASQVLKCWRKQRPLRPQSQHCIQTLFVNLVVLAGVPELIISHFDEMLFCSPWTSSPLTV